jgi:hypothetical protein
VEKVYFNRKSHENLEAHCPLILVPKKSRLKIYLEKPQGLTETHWFRIEIDV